MVSDQRVLLVDDEPDVLETVSSYLSERGYRVATAAKWTDAITSLQDATPDIVLLDLDLPTVRGAALLEFIRESHRDLPVLIASSAIDTKTLDHLAALGASGIVRKPFDSEDLLIVVEQALIGREGASSDEVSVPTASDPVQTVPPEEDGAAEEILASSATAAVLPGAGVGTVESLRATPSPQARRRVKKRRGGGRSRRLRAYVITCVLCVLVGLLLWRLGNSLSSGLFGIGISQSPGESVTP